MWRCARSLVHNATFITSVQARSAERHHLKPGYASPRRIRTAAKPSSTTAYAQNTPNPVHGASDVAGSGCTDVTARPAAPGRYLPTSSARPPGRKPTTIGIANSRPNSAEIPPAVLRRSVPRARPSSPATARYSAPPITARTTPGSPSDTDRCWRPRIDCPARNTASAAGTLTATIEAASAAALPHSVGSRRGTAASVVLISPDAYSLVISSTPSTPAAICASCTPARLTETGSNELTVAPCGGLAARSRLYRMPNPTIRITADSSDHSAPGWVRSLVHSDLITRTWVTRNVLISPPWR